MAMSWLGPNGRRWITGNMACSLIPNGATCRRRKNNRCVSSIEDYLNSLALSYYDTKPIVRTVRPEKNQVFIASGPMEMEVEAYANDYTPVPSRRYHCTRASVRFF